MNISKKSSLNRQNNKPTEHKFASWKLNVKQNYYLKVCWQLYSSPYEWKFFLLNIFVPLRDLRDWVCFLGLRKGVNTLGLGLWASKCSRKFVHSVNAKHSSYSVRRGHHTAQSCSTKTYCTPSQVQGEDALPPRHKSKQPNFPASHKHMALQCFVYARAISLSIKNSFGFVEIDGAGLFAWRVACVQACERKLFLKFPLRPRTTKPIRTFSRHSGSAPFVYLCDIFFRMPSHHTNHHASILHNSVQILHNPVPFFRTSSRHTSHHARHKISSTAIFRIIVPSSFVSSARLFAILAILSSFSKNIARSVLERSLCNLQK